MSPQRANWTHRSVTAIAEHADPAAFVTGRARAVVLDALQRGWSGPPFDPCELAKYLGVSLSPRHDILDARILPIGREKLRIEYNPNRPRGRMRFSIAHDLAHTLFPDCREAVRNRLPQHKMVADDWQLEMLCNLGASEMLMPIGSFPDLGREELNIDNLLAIRSKYDVSMEALLLRVVRLTREPCIVFCASRKEPGGGASRYQIDYATPSRALAGVGPLHAVLLPDDTVIRECTAIGFTAKGFDTWPNVRSRMRVECVGIPGYAGHAYPRVVGIAVPSGAKRGALKTITELTGDASQPRGDGSRIVAHVVNDGALVWGAGFGLQVRKKWPAVQRAYRTWVMSGRGHASMGNVCMTRAEDALYVCQMVCQRGFGPSTTPRIRYVALELCLEKLSVLAGKMNASVHMPRIGTGEAGGSWAVVKELIENILCEAGIAVSVYQLPPRRERAAGRASPVAVTPIG